MSGCSPAFLAEGSQIEGPGRPLLASIVACDSLWVAARFKSDAVHVFAGSALRHIVHFPEDLCHLEFGVRSASEATAAQTHLQDQQICLLAITEPCRAWLLVPTMASTPTGTGTAPAGGLSAMQASTSKQRSGDGAPAASNAVQPVEVQWQELPALAGGASDLPQPVRAPTSLAALLVSAAGLLGNPAGPASLAAQIVWEYLADSPSMLHGAPDQPPDLGGLFLDLSVLGGKYSRERQADVSGRGSSHGTVSALAGACCEGALPSLGGATCSLHVQAHGAQGWAGAPPSGVRDKLHCSSRATLNPGLYRALLEEAVVDREAGGGSCLLVGDFSGKVWAHQLSSRSALKATTGTAHPVAAAAEHSRDIEGPVLLFDIKQPVLGIHPAAAQAAHSSGGQSHDCLVIVGRGGHVVQISARERPEPESARLPGRGVPAASLAIKQMRLRAPVASAAVAQGVLYCTGDGRAHAALLPCVLEESKSAFPTGEAGAPKAPARRDSWHKLQPLLLECFGQRPHLLSVCEPCSPAVKMQPGGGAADGYAAAVAGSLVMLCMSGALFEGTLLSAKAVSAVKPALPSSKVQQEVKVLIEGINDLTACKALLEPHLAAADAGLAELALSIPLVQGLRDGRNLQCWVGAALQANVGGVAPDVLVTVGLKNSGPYPVTQAWSVLIVSRAPVLPGAKDFGMKAHAKVGVTGIEMQRVIPLEGLPVGRTWKQSHVFERMQTSSLEVSVYMCHRERQGGSEGHCTSALLKTARIDMLHLMRPLPFQTALERTCLVERSEQQRTTSLTVLVHALSSMPTASHLLRQILSVGVDSRQVPQGDRGTGTGALALLNGSSVTGIVSLGCKSATLTVHAALQFTSATAPGAGTARLELTLKCLDVAILAAAHESMSWRLQEWQRLQPSSVREEGVTARKAALERAQADLHELQQMASALQKAEEGVKQLRQLADRGSGLHSQGLAFSALLQQSLSLKAGLGFAYLKLRNVSAALPYSVTLQ